MLAISLWQPFASLYVLGAKRFETRSWKPPPAHLLRFARGEWLAIHAAKLDTTALRGFTNSVEVLNGLGRGGIHSWDALPRGAIVGVVRIGTIHTSSSSVVHVYLSENFKEKLFGDFSPGRYCWEANKAHAFHKAVPERGRQGFWNWEPKEPVLVPMKGLMMNLKQLSTEENQ